MGETVPGVENAVSSWGKEFPWWKTLLLREAMRVSQNPNCAAFVQTADTEINRANATVKALEK